MNATTEARLKIRNELRNLKQKLGGALLDFENECGEIAFEQEDVLTDGERKLISAIIVTINDAETGIWSAVDMNGIRAKRN